MQVKRILCLFVLQTVYTLIQANLNECQVANSCKECITLSPKCSWCQILEYKSPTTLKYYRKCDLVQNHLDQGCNYTYNPVSTATITKDAVLTGDHRVSPKAVKVKLRPGQPAHLNVRVKTPRDFPVDLYFLMDLSQSMRDDLVQIIDLADSLTKEMNRVTSNFKLGFGGFVDKPLGPYTYTSPDEVKSIESDGSQYTFSFKNYLPLTENTTKFKETIQTRVKSSFNVDSPEGSLEAMMQVIVCQKDIGWRDKRKARRVVLLATDHTFHYAGDGLLGGVVIPNDGTCNLKDGYEYTAWNKYDYPSLSHIRAVTIDRQIVPIFASLGNDELYVELAKYFGQNSGAVADRLSNDSSNIIHIVKGAYQKIAKRVSIVSSWPNGIDIEFKTNCGVKDKEPVKSSFCGNIHIGEEVTFTASITAWDCNAGTNFQLKTNFDDIDIDLEMICQCPCQELRVHNSTSCTSRGDLACGLCHCNKGFAGRKCQCTEEEAKNITLCKRTGILGEICSGRGECECGECICDPINTQNGITEYIYGDQCQCTNTSCGKSNGQQTCGGPERGICDCGKCFCNENWTGAACGELCPKGSDNCRSTGNVICSDKGKCLCNKCVCDEGYVGNQCQKCIFNCPNPCEDYKECVKCLAFDTSELTTEECQIECAKYNISINYKAVDSIPKDERCIARDEDDCSIIFTSTKSYVYGEERVLTIRRERICPAEADIMAIFLGLIGAIVGIGLILLIIWRIIATLQDRREFAKFNEERNDPKWDTLGNPIFVRATSTFENPTYGHELYGEQQLVPEAPKFVGMD